MLVVSSGVTGIALGFHSLSSEESEGGNLERANGTNFCRILFGSRWSGPAPNLFISVYS